MGGKKRSEQRCGAEIGVDSGTDASRHSCQTLLSFEVLKPFKFKTHGILWAFRQDSLNFEEALQEENLKQGTLTCGVEP